MSVDVAVGDAAEDVTELDEEGAGAGLDDGLCAGVDEGEAMGLGEGLVTGLDGG